MPHFGLMDERALGPEAGSLLRARLHIRGGKRRLRQGKIAAGIVTLYDALCSALQWYIAAPERRARLKVKEDEDLRDDSTLYNALLNSGVIDKGLDWDEFDRLVDRALKEDLADYDYRQIVGALDNVMLNLGIMPFDETALPPEDPSTF